MKSTARALFLTTIAATSCVAAVFSHLGIDVLGDYVLAHDAYDDVPHASRVGGLVAGGGLTFALAVVLAILAWREARGGRASIRAALNATLGPSRLAFVGLVNLASSCGVLAMASADAIFSGAGLTSIGEACGGSIWLALAITLPVASGAALVVRGLLQRLLAHSRVLVAAVRALACLVELRVPGAGTHVRTERRGALSRKVVRVTGNAGKRGPPLAV